MCKAGQLTDTVWAPLSETLQHILQISQKAAFSEHSRIGTPLSDRVDPSSHLQRIWSSQSWTPAGGMPAQRGWLGLIFSLRGIRLLAWEGLALKTEIQPKKSIYWRLGMLDGHNLRFVSRIHRAIYIYDCKKGEKDKLIHLPWSWHRLLKLCLSWSGQAWMLSGIDPADQLLILVRLTAPGGEEKHVSVSHHTRSCSLQSLP